MRRVVHQQSVCVDSYQILPFFWLNCSACADYSCSGAYILESQKNSDVLRATHVYSPMDGIGNGYHQLSCYKSGGYGRKRPPLYHVCQIIGERIAPLKKH